MVRWRVLPQPTAESVAELAESLSLPKPLAALLIQRDLRDVDSVRAFLRPSLSSLSNPYLLADMPEAVARISKAVKEGENILIYGDYDVDGQCATALLVRALRQAGGKVHFAVPDRLIEGYGFQRPAISLAEELGVTLVITCDCGVTSVAEVAEASARGISTVITDHHQPGPELPPAVAVVNPNRKDDTSGLGDLCGAGVAFKLVQALVGPLGLPENYPMHLLDYVAVATIADVVALRGENRILVRHGLKLLEQTSWPGLKALLEGVGVGKMGITAGDVGYGVAPRLNAAGRVAHARLGIDLLLSDVPVEGAVLARRLEEYNKERRQLDQAIRDQAMTEIAAQQADPGEFPAIVLSGSDWHPGVIGIVASRVVERYGRPTFMIAIDEDGIGKGSGRSVAGFDLHAALTECADLLERYGGHAMAAGVTLRADRIDAFRARLCTIVTRELKPEQLGPTQLVDLELHLSAATHELERYGRYLEPCGSANRTPVFGVREVLLEKIRMLGNSHLKLTLTQGGSRLDGIAFGWADRAPWLTDTTGAVLADVAFVLEENVWNGRSALQARIVALAPAGQA